VFVYDNGYDGDDDDDNNDDDNSKYICKFFTAHEQFW